MPRYLVERTFDPMGSDEFQEALVMSKQLAAERFPDLTWDHSHMFRTKSGIVRSFCVYEAPDMDQVMAHADALGGHSVDAIYEVVLEVDPRDL